MDTVTVEPTENHIYCETIGKVLGYKELMKKTHQCGKTERVKN